MSTRRCDLSDLDRLSELFDLYRQFYQRPSDLSGARKFLRERFERAESTIFGAYVPGDNKLNGFVQLYPSFSSVGMQRTWILNDLFVTEAARGRGLAKELMLAAQDYVLALGGERMSLMTAVTNGPAQRLYERLGWVRNQEFYTYNWRRQ